MAVFGAPLSQPDHADRALRAAREMIDTRLCRFNVWLRDREFSARGFRMGIGLNSGMVMTGNVGSEQRVEYTAIGDTTNSASRLEALTKNSDRMLLIAQSTKDLLMHEPDDLLYIGEFDIRGRQASMHAWSVLDPSTAPPPPAPRPRAADEYRSGASAAPEATYPAQPSTR